MEQTLQSLAGILLKAIPTIALLVLLHFYLKSMLFRPLSEVLKKRDDLTDGTRHAALNSLKLAEEKVVEYENKLRDARGEVYREQEELRKQWLADQAAQIASARENLSAQAAGAKAQIAKEVVAARESLSQSAPDIARQIVAAVVARRAG